MNPDQAWQTVLGQLQMEMSKASFDTWIRDTRALDYDADTGVLTVGVRNAYTRDWLSDRLSSTVARLLIGIMKRTVEVEFVVAETNDAGEHNDDELSDMAENEVEIAAEEYDSVYDQIVHPDRAVMLPGYFRRWLRVLGPDLGWMYVGFRQAAYRAGGRRARKRARFSGKEIAALCGISERTFWNRVEKPATWQTLAGLVHVAAENKKWKKGRGKPKRLSRRYTVAMTLPLTPADTLSLCNWIGVHIEEYGGPEGALRAAATAPLKELLPLDSQADAGDQPQTVRQVVRDLFRGDLPDEQLDALSAAIQNHIMPPNDLIKITLFFIEHILPHLGAGPGWMLTLLRDRCYENEETGEVRNQVVVQGGYTEIAGWMGLSRARTVWDWLYVKHFKSRQESRKESSGKPRVGGRKASEVGKLRNPVIRVYLREVAGDEKAVDFATSPRTFDVLLNDVPTEILERALTGKTPEDLVAVCSIGLSRFAEDLVAVCSIKLSRFAEDLVAVCRVLNSLNSSLSSKALKKTPPLPPSRKKGGIPTGESGGWSLEKFFAAHTKIPPATRERLLAKGAPAQDYVAWLLYAHSPEGKGIETPTIFAASRLQKGEQPDSEYTRLAHWPPVRLLDEIAAACDPGKRYAHTSDELFKSVFRGRDGYDRRKLQALEAALLTDGKAAA